MRWRIGLEIYRVVDPLIGPEAAYTDHPAFCLADVCQPLPAHMSRMLAPLAIPVLVDDQNAFVVGGGVRRLLEREEQFEPAIVELLRAPPRFREEPLQALRFFALRSYNRLGVGKSGQSLVAFGG